MPRSLTKALPCPDKPSIAVLPFPKHKRLRPHPHILSCGMAASACAQAGRRNGRSPPAMGNDLSAAAFVSQLQALTGDAGQDVTIAVKPAADQEVHERSGAIPACQPSRISV